MSPQPAGGNIPSLPLDIYPQIFSYLPQETVKSCRLLSRALTPMATSQAFYHVYLSAANASSPANFARIARSPSLRSQVTEVTIDTWVGPGFEYHAGESYPWPVDFFRALPCLRVFSNTRTLNVRFTEWCGDNELARNLFTSYEEDYDFRCWTLDAVFKSAVGLWNVREQSKWDEEVSKFDTGTKRSKTSPGYTSPGIPTLKTFTISNLADFDDRRITESAAFRRVMHSPSLTELKLLITTGVDNAYPEYPELSERYEFFRTLNQIWLSPPIARKLEVLSTFCGQYWGWAPRAEFRSVNPGSGPDDPSAGFPRLRVLALGKYLFSHDWQVDWIASLGKQNGCKGLQELYLDHCPILWDAVYESSLAEGMTTIVYDDKDSVMVTEFEVSDKGYYREDVMTGLYSGHLNHINPHDKLEVHYNWDTRWADTINTWHDSMPGLRILKMGHGSLHCQLSHLIVMANSMPKDWVEFYDTVNSHANVISDVARNAIKIYPSARDQTLVDQEYAIRFHMCQDRVHLDYNRPSPPQPHATRYGRPIEVESIINKLTIQETLVKAAPFKFGAGLRQSRVDLMQYVRFKHGFGRSPWFPDVCFDPENLALADDEDEINDHTSTRMPRYREVMRRDDEALASFNAMIAERNRTA